MQHLKKYLSVLLVFLFVTQTTTLASAAEPIDEARDIIRKYYVEDVPDSVLNKPTIKEITRHLDPYSVYMTAEEFNEFTNAIENQFVGIGVMLEEDPKGVKILAVYPGSPAERAGIQTGDVITNINGQSLAGESVQTAISYLSREEKTSVTLTYERPVTGQSFTQTLVREVIQLQNVEYEMLGGNIGYVRLNSFSLDSAKDISAAIQKLKGAKGWIFDLRDNGGGYVSAAQEVAGFFPNVTKAFQLRDKTNKPHVFNVIPQSVKFTAPVHILVNAYSASASEMVSASVKEQKGAVLYGQNSFGKGSMQSFFPLSDESVLKLTTAKFFSPKGVPVHEVGVAPNVKTAEGEELLVSHRDQLVATIRGYKKLPALQNVPVTKTFTIKMNMKMNWTGITASDVQLIQLGGKEVPVDVKAIDEKTIKVTPKQNLQSKGKYLLIVHPKWKAENSRQMKQGIYVDVTAM
ncbi:carboxyl-terminal processing protease [Bacillus methanolicus PB1]|uniref:Carboxyl-terminal processing protease n=1 Tax=Bacillus methanolicus PB1 TaxID=997296 RepID=I3E1J2_BACMT|nr:S41 family peptidase [Bacillus methanolicus]EIJ80363.1 carboxyl-terminal processing protease [Bacillus methanolicus PB1]